jgi:hypothetical protein
MGERQAEPSAIASSQGAVRSPSHTLFLGGVGVGVLTDFGPVDESLLAARYPYRDAPTSLEVYQSALRKHHLSTKSK